MNGEYFTSLISLDGVTDIIACSFYNCTNRSFYLHDEKAKLTLKYCLFYNCGIYNQNNANGGCFYANCSNFIITKTRFFHPSSPLEGIAFYSISNGGYSLMLSISNNIIQDRSHYFYFNLGQTSSKELNVSNFKSKDDIFCKSSQFHIVKYMHVQNHIGRTFFRFSCTICKSNIVDSSFQHLIFYENFTLIQLFFSNVQILTSYSYYFPNSPTIFIDCIFKSIDLKITNETAQIINSYSSGTSFKCLVNIPILFSTCSNNNIFTFYISSILSTFILLSSK